MLMHSAHPKRSEKQKNLVLNQDLNHDTAAITQNAHRDIWDPEERSRNSFICLEQLMCLLKCTLQMFR